MRGTIRFLLMALMFMSCSSEGISPDDDLDYRYGRQLSHEKIVLGERLENPYKTENITKALNELYPTKAGRVEVPVTDLYVRFLPKDDAEVKKLESYGLYLSDYPLDYEIAVDGDWYHDPEVPEGNITWQYAVVPSDFTFPDMEYEIIDECHISDDSISAKSEGDDVDWGAVERMAYLITGNEKMLAPETKASKKVYPSGRITLVDEDYAGGQPAGVAGVRVSCNSFVKFAHAYTDKDGYYQMPKKFASDLRYKLVFENEKGFSIGFNMILVPASVSTLGKASPDGINMTVTKDSEAKLYKRCVVNNAAYDYYERCSASDLNIALPVKDIRIWLFHGLEVSSAVMLHHGAILDSDFLTSFLGNFAPLIKYFLPDITIGVKSDNDYRSIYSSVCHELAHVSHFSQVGTSYWNKYILYIVGSYISSGGMTYGDGRSVNSGYCEIGEMWAYYLESKMYHERYGGSYPTFGTSFWFRPQIFRYLEEKGLKCNQIFDALTTKVTSLQELERTLTAACPDMTETIELIFDRYR